jgi:hypothetical protein
VHNKTTKDYGDLAALGRCVEIDVSLPPTVGSLLLSTGAWDSKAIGNIDLVKANESASIDQIVRISPDAPSYAQVDVHFDLYLSVPQDLLVSGVEEIQPELQLIQQYELKVQISSHYTHNESAGFLLITNSSTTKERVQTLRCFIEGDLKMHVDEWNMSLYGGLQYQIEEGETSSVISTYEGKTIIFLGNDFEFFQSGTRNIFQLCDLEPLAEATLKGTTCLFLGSSSNAAYRDLFQSLIFPLTEGHEQTPSIGSTVFDTAKEMASSVFQNKVLGNSSFAVYSIPAYAKWYRLGFANNSKSEAKRIAKYLRRCLPQERFIVRAIPPEHNCAVPTIAFTNDKPKKKDLGIVAVYHGLPHAASLRLVEAQPIQWSRNDQNVSSQSAEARQQNPGGSSPVLDRYEGYFCVAALPRIRRVEMLWFPVGNDNAVESEPAICCFEAAANSLLIEINAEINRFLVGTSWPNPTNLTGSGTSCNVDLRLHFPTLAVLLSHPTSSTPGRPPENILIILQYSLASTFPQKKRDVATSTIVPFGHRRAHIRKYLTRLYNTYLTHRGYSSEDLKAFHTSTKSLHSIFNPEKRNTSKVITQRVAEFTRKSEHAFKTAQINSGDVVARTMACDAVEWRQRIRNIERRKEAINVDRARAMEALKKLVVTPGSVLADGENEHPQVEIGGTTVAELS